MPDAEQGYEVPESGTLTEASDAAYAAKILAAIVESREFLAQFRAAHPVAPHDPDELQARMMRRSGCPTVEHYSRVFQAEGMSAEEAVAEARRMVEADRELLARYPAL